MRFSKFSKFYASGTTASVANQPLLTKEKNTRKDSNVFPVGMSQEGVYIENYNRNGVQFKTDEAAFRAVGATTQIKKLKLTKNLAIVLYSYASEGYVKAEIVSDAGAVTFGTAVKFNDAAISSCDMERISDVKFAISYIDDGGNDYLCGMVFTVTAAGAITKGTEKELNAAACSKNGTGICSPRDGVLAFCFALASDGHIDVIACTYSVTTFDAPGSSVEFDSTANSTGMCIESYATGKIVIGYADGGTNGTYRLGTVEINALVETAGAAATFETTGAATSIKVMSPILNTVMFGWIDSTFAHALCATIDGVTVTKGTEKALTAAASLTFDFDMLDDTHFIGAYENDAVSDLGSVMQFSRVGTAITAGNVDVFTLSACKATAVCGLTDVGFLVGFSDDGDSDIGKVMFGGIEKYLIDVRSTAASIGFGFYMVSLEKNGLGALAAYFVSGTTHGSANTAMSTKAVLPFRKHQNVFVLSRDNGIYVEDDGTELPKLSGVAHDGTNRTIDVRSTTTSEVFKICVLRINNKIRSLTG